MDGDFHYKDKAVMRPPYLCIGNPYNGKTTPLYLDSPRVDGLKNVSAISSARVNVQTYTKWQSSVNYISFSMWFAINMIIIKWKHLSIVM